MHFLIERNNLSRLGFTDDRLLVVETGGDRSLHIQLYDAIASTVKHGFSQAKNSGTSGGEGLDA